MTTTMKQGENLVIAGDILTLDDVAQDLTDTDLWLVTGTIRYGNPSASDTRDLIFLPEELASGLVQPRLHWSDSPTTNMKPGKWVWDARVYDVVNDDPRFIATGVVIVEDAVTDSPEAP